MIIRWDKNLYAALKLENADNKDQYVRDWKETVQT